MLTLLIAGAVAVDAYRGFAQRRQRVDEAWARLDEHLERRQDIIPGLVDEVRDYMSFEQGVLSRVLEARARAISAGAEGDVAEQAEAEHRLSGALRSLLVVIESYPMLTAKEDVLELQDQLTMTDHQIGVAQQQYNTTVEDYNDSVGHFPKAILAALLGFRRRKFFDAAPTMDEIPVTSQ